VPRNEQWGQHMMSVSMKLRAPVAIRPIVAVADKSVHVQTRKLPIYQQVSDENEIDIEWNSPFLCLLRRFRTCIWLEIDGIVFQSIALPRKGPLHGD